MFSEMNYEGVSLTLPSIISGAFNTANKALEVLDPPPIRYDRDLLP